MNTRTFLAALTAVLAPLTPAFRAQVPQMINYQGRVTVGTTNFNSPPNGIFKFALVDGGTNTSVQATATAVRIGGSIAAVNVTAAGFGYTTVPTVTITGGGGTGATATTTLFGSAVPSITMTNNGSGYTYERKSRA